MKRYLQLSRTQILPSRASVCALASVSALAAVVGACGGGSAPGSIPSEPTQPRESGLANGGCTLSYSGVVPPETTGSDWQLANQWHLSNDGSTTGLAGEDLGATAAWPSTRGAGARVAIVDYSIETSHQDFAASVVPEGSYDYRLASRGGLFPMPCQAGDISDRHGTSVAAIVGARDGNGVGGVGVASRASLVAYNPLSTGTESDLLDALNRGLDSNDVYNSSWGAADSGTLQPATAAFSAAIDNGIRRGRGGKGAVYVFSGGNGGCYALSGSEPDRPCLSDNSNYDGYLNKLGVVTVCATDSSGTQPSYGERGANVLLCAPSSGDRPGSAIRTADISDGYRDDFTGTSASAPQVAGIAALILAVNPALTWRDVRLILARTARQNDPSDPEWTASNGLRFNPKYGFGVAHAGAAVGAALNWPSVGGSEALLSCGPYVTSAGLTLADPVGNQVSPVASSVSAAGCAISQIEFIEVRVSATHASSGDIRLRLLSPSGLISELADDRICYDQSLRAVSCGLYDNFPFGSVRHLDEPVASNGNGVWTLEATDMRAPEAGRLDQWSITFYGRSSVDGAAAVDTAGVDAAPAVVSAAAVSSAAVVAAGAAPASATDTSTGAAKTAASKTAPAKTTEATAPAAAGVSNGALRVGGHELWLDPTREAVASAATEGGAAMRLRAIAARAPAPLASNASATPSAKAAAASDESVSPVYVDAAGRPRALPGGAIVTFATALTDELARAAIEATGRRAARRLGPRIWLVQTASGNAALTAVAALTASGRFASVEPNWWQTPVLK